MLAQCFIFISDSLLRCKSRGQCNRKKRKTNLSNSTLNCVPGVELEYIEDRDVRKQHIVGVSLWKSSSTMKEGMYCPSCNADMVPKTSVLKSHLNARHEKVSKAAMKIERRKKKTELTANERFALMLTVPASSSTVEMVYSQAEMSTNGGRNRISSTLLKDQLLLYLNYGQLHGQC
uniref:BED-type domain-containing protein n=1 Tax=Ditylenchus dipsaci TaxID=166011 RepID=A0A915DMJ0_9BILA